MARHESRRTFRNVDDYRRHNAAVERRAAEYFRLEGGASKSLAQRRADAPLRPAVEQRPTEFGLFGDRQLDLADRLDLKP